MKKLLKRKDMVSSVAYEFFFIFLFYRNRKGTIIKKNSNLSQFSESPSITYSVYSSYSYNFEIQNSNQYFNNIFQNALNKRVSLNMASFFKEKIIYESFKLSLKSTPMHTEFNP